MAASKWIKKFNKSEILTLGGARQFERIVGLVKDTLYNMVGKPKLEWKKVEEKPYNNSPLTY